MWSRTELQLEFLGRVVKKLGEEHLHIQIQVLEMLKSKFAVALSKMESVVLRNVAVGDSQINRWKYVAVRKSIDETVASLERWQRIFDPSWFLMLRVADGVIDLELARSAAEPAAAQNSAGRSGSTIIYAQQLRGSIRGQDGGDIHVNLPSCGLDWSSVERIPFSSVRLVKRAGPSLSKTYAIDSIPLTATTDSDVARVRADAEKLAKKLHHVQEDCGMMACQGLIKHRDGQTRRLASIDVLFTIDVDLKMPISLRQILLVDGKATTSCSLTDVLRVARRLAAAVSFLHTCDFVHKNIRPETIILFQLQLNQSGVGCEQGLGRAYLAGFDSFRGVTSHTARAGDDDWARDLYRHPTRQGLLAHDEYIMQHDVYSLGVCLLELGIGRSFVVYGTEDGGGRLEPEPSGALDLEDKKGVVAALLHGDDSVSQGNSGAIRNAIVDLQRRLELKDHLVRLAKSKLPARMGNIYTAVVVTCLTCLDSNNEDFGEEESMRDEDGILIGVMFIEKVLFRLDSIMV